MKVNPQVIGICVLGQLLQNFFADVFNKLIKQMLLKNVCPWQAFAA
jgi:hypothetical protein